MAHADTQVHEARPTAAMLVVAWASVLVTWLTWLALSIPALGVPRGVVGAATLASALAGFVVGAGLIGARRWTIGAGAGLLAGVTNLLVLGSDLVDARAGAPPLLVGALGYLALSTLLGAGGVWGVGRLRARALESDGVRLALVQTCFLCVALVALLLLGGAVTSTRSGLAVPDWPGSFGLNMFLLPFSRMTDPRVFTEHSHRLFGAMVGVTALATYVVTVLAARVERRTVVQSVIVLAWGAASAIALYLTTEFQSLSRFMLPATVLLCVALGTALVVTFRAVGGVAWVHWTVTIALFIGVQGFLGGSRVVEQSQALAIAHGVLAHLIFAMAFAQAMRVTEAVRSIPAGGVPDVSRRLRSMSTALLHTTILQIVLGAIYRHLKETSSGAAHTLYTHIAISLAVVVFALIAGFLMIRERQKAPAAARTMRVLGVGLITCVSLQFILGWAALGVVMMAPRRGAPPTAEQLAANPASEQTRAVPAAEVAVTLAHHTNGALLLGLASGGVVVARRLRKRGA